MDNKHEEAVRSRGLTKVYGEGESAVMALDKVDVELESGRMIAVIGASGSGKSTLLHVLSGLDAPTYGDSWVDGVHVQDLKGKRQAKFRREKMGFVFQQHALIPVLTVRENILLENSLDKTKPDPKEFKRVVGELDLADRLDHLPDQLSGGQRQKTAIARVMMQKPSVVFADEPTGSLDVESSKTVMRLLKDLVEDLGMTVLMVTHSVEAAMMADRVIALSDGRLILDTTSPTVEVLEAAVSAHGAKDGTLVETDGSVTGVEPLPDEDRSATPDTQTHDLNNSGVALHADGAVSGDHASDGATASTGDGREAVVPVEEVGLDAE